MPTLTDEELRFNLQFMRDALASAGDVECAETIEDHIAALTAQRDKATAELASLKSPADLEAIAAEAFPIMWPDADFAKAAAFVKERWLEVVGHIAAHYRGEKAPGDLDWESLIKVISNHLTVCPWDECCEDWHNRCRRCARDVAARVRAASAADLAADAKCDREQLGRFVRGVWVQWAQKQPNPKPSWLLPWYELSEPDREVDRQIGEALWKSGYAACKAQHAAELAERDARIAELEREKERVTNLLDKADTAANELAKALGERTDVMYGEWVADLGELVKKVVQLRDELAGVRQRAEGAIEEKHAATCEYWAQKRLADRLAAELAAAKQQLAAVTWERDNCKRNKISAEGECEELGQQLAAKSAEVERVTELISWMRMKIPEWAVDFNGVLEELKKLRPGSYRASARLDDMWSVFDRLDLSAAPLPSPAPAAFVCPGCGETATSCGPNAKAVYCKNLKCTWEGTWSEVEAAQAGARGEGQ